MRMCDRNRRTLQDLDFRAPLMIARETLEAEVVALTSEVNRRISAVRGLFAEVAGLRGEIELLKRILNLRDQAHPQTDSVSVVLLGFVPDDGAEPTPFCAVTWSGSKEQPSEVRVLLKAGWRDLLPPSILDYFLDLSSDWRQSLPTRPAAIVSLISELSVGSLRTMHDTTLRESKAKDLIKERLGEVELLSNLKIIR